MKKTAAGTTGPSHAKNDPIKGAKNETGHILGVGMFAGTQTDVPGDTGDMSFIKAVDKIHGITPMEHQDQAMAPQSMSDDAKYGPQGDPRFVKKQAAPDGQKGQRAEMREG